MPTIIIVAGPNGAGKTSFIRTYLPHAVRENFVRLDADEIERELKLFSVDAPDKALAAGRVLLERLQDLIDARSNLIVETTLSLRVYANRIPEWRDAG